MKLLLFMTFLFSIFLLFKLKSNIADFFIKKSNLHKVDSDDTEVKSSSSLSLSDREDVPLIERSIKDIYRSVVIFSQEVFSHKINVSVSELKLTYRTIFLVVVLSLWFFSLIESSNMLASISYTLLALISLYFGRLSVEEKK